MAVFPPPSIVSALRDVLPSDATLTAAAKWHITLVFLGDVVEPDRVSEVLSSIPRPGPFALRLSGSGSFGAAAWVGISGDLSALAGFREQVRAGLEGGGFPSDPRPFRPHLTVSYRGDAAIHDAIAGYSGDEWVAEEFALVASENGRYNQLRAWQL